MMTETILSINWSVSPEAFSIWTLTIRWYGILFSCAFIACYYAFKELLKHDVNLPKDFPELALTYMVIGTIVGARLGDCFFYNPEHYLKNPLEIFATWRGGLSSHGGAIGILVALYLLGRKVKKPYIWVLDRVVIVIGVAGFFIRTGNLMNSEIYGEATNFPWGFIFLNHGETIAKHPTQIYEALYYALTFLTLRFIYRKFDNRPKPYLIFGIFLIMVFVFRFCIEFIKNPQGSDVEDKLMEAIGLNMGQFLSVPFIILGVIAIIVGLRQLQPALETTTPNPVHHHHKKKPKAVEQQNKKQQKKKK